MYGSIYVFDKIKQFNIQYELHDFCIEILQTIAMDKIQRGKNFDDLDQLIKMLERSGKLELAIYYRCLQEVNSEGFNFFEYMKSFEIVKPYIIEHFGQHSIEYALLNSCQTVTYSNK